MMEIGKRRHTSRLRIANLRHDLRDARQIVRGKACVYATGSYGREEASAGSDLDLFIIGENNHNVIIDGIQGSLLSRLDEICVKAKIIDVARKNKIADFDSDGRYFHHYSIDQFVRILGRPEDDVKNTFTARLLLLLESRPIIGISTYEKAVRSVIRAYWQDFYDHESEFVPAFLANDILRLWRTFCVNYEAGFDRASSAGKLKAKIKNYNLKHSRLLTCFSGIIYLLAIYSLNGTVGLEDGWDMVRLTPVERLIWVSEREEMGRSRAKIRRALRLYNKFLKVKSQPRLSIEEIFLDRTARQPLMNDAVTFGELVFDVLGQIGLKGRFHRLLMV